MQTRTRLLILRHVRETWKRSNTARLAARALPNARLVSYCSPDEPFDTATLSEPGTWLLYPDGPRAPEGAPPPKTLVVLDGSWAQVRRMTQRIPELRALPRLSLPPPAADTLRLRTPTHPAGMSTLEAIAHAVALLEGAEVAEPLEKLHALRVQRIVEAGSFINPITGRSQQWE